jgi:hypothetical protein
MSGPVFSALAGNHLERQTTATAARPIVTEAINGRIPWRTA